MHRQTRRREHGFANAIVDHLSHSRRQMRPPATAGTSCWNADQVGGFEEIGEGLVLARPRGKYIARRREHLGQAERRTVP